MGLFDSIICEYPLPGVPHDTILSDFQTKSLECRMESYTITEDGRLIHHSVRCESVPEEERIFYNKPEWEKGPLYQLCGSMKTIPNGDIFLSDFTGLLNFYTSTGHHHDGSFIWYEWYASFAKGMLVEIHRQKSGWP